MNVVSLPNKSKLPAHTASRYTVVIQYKDRRQARKYIKYDSFVQARDTIKLYRGISGVSYIYTTYLTKNTLRHMTRETRADTPSRSSE
jgi:hypothetical protein